MKVLVVDDELDVKPLFLQRFRREIKAGEVSLDFASSGDEALLYLNNGSSEVVLILSDINMPGMSGLELLEAIRKKHGNSPPFIMMITAYGDEENKERSMALGANDFLTKPLDFGALKTKFKALEV